MPTWGWWLITINYKVNEYYVELTKILWNLKRRKEVEVDNGRSIFRDTTFRYNIQWYMFLKAPL